MNKENYVIKNASEFSTEEKNKFKEIVLSMGEVSENTFDGLMRKNPVILFYPNTNNIEAVGALKVPNKSYKTKVFDHSKTEFESVDFEYELGWIVSLKQKKGIGKLITEVLSEFKPKIYSTVRTENIGMNKIMNSLGFEKTGIEYKSERGNYNNLLYIKIK
ncbi:MULTISPECIES: hypothetical protein [Winogradskyella]|jgi:hypothetical protein|uniref:hypothetical protein n=1 Tax=Winogradskyella TaxID=286104 RepID=UPI0015CBC1D4|nr:MULTISPECIES: hypothetical protein [Winogradskyella]QXP78802.1 hypothetical protein H0I32_16595 [Winogradskyella sp. HaHa_3_26]